MLYAAIDLGTNTFNLLIAEKNGNKLVTILSTRRPVKLGQGGINQKVISTEAYKRGIEALQEFKSIIENHHCAGIKAAGTSMLRDAVNGKNFVEEVKQKLNIDIEIIDGEREADLIYKGVLCGTKITANSLIMDIGGGSTEFIICNSEKVFFKKSYPLGVTRLYESFPHSDPVRENESAELRSHILSLIPELISACRKYNVKHLIGSAGSFESYASILSFSERNEDADFSISSHTLDFSAFASLLDSLIASSHKERCDLKGLIEMRRDLIVTASLLIQTLIRETSICSTELSVCAMKEGLLTELFENN